MIYPPLIRQKQTGGKTQQAQSHTQIKKPFHILNVRHKMKLYLNRAVEVTIFGLFVAPDLYIKGKSK